MRRRRSRTVLAAVLSLWPAALPAQDLELGGAAFLLVPVGARATALGQAAVADGGSSEAAFWNPAGLAWLPRSEFAIHHARTFVSKNTAVAGYLASDRLGVIGLAAYLVDLGGQPVIPPTGGDPVGRLSTKGVELLASYATTFAGRASIGVSYKLIQFRNECQGNCGAGRTVIGTTHAVDVGLQYVTGPALTLGLALRHAGFRLQLENKDQADPLPTRVQLGASYRVFLPPLGGPDDRFDARFLLDLQEPWGEYGDPEPLIGIDFGFRDLIRIRTGYALLEAAARGPSLGIGIHYDRITVDFARVFYASGTFDEPAYLSLRIDL